MWKLALVFWDGILDLLLLILLTIFDRDGEPRRDKIPVWGRGETSPVGIHGDGDGGILPPRGRDGQLPPDGEFPIDTSSDGAPLPKRWQKASSMTSKSVLEPLWQNVGEGIAMTLKSKSKPLTKTLAKVLSMMPEFLAKPLTEMLAKASSMTKSLPKTLVKAVLLMLSRWQQSPSLKC